MSRWLTDELHVSLSPAQVGVAQVRRSLGIKGIKREVIVKQSIACSPAPQAFVWDGAMQALDSLLPQYAEAHPNVIIVLSNHFVRYALVPWSDLVTGEEQLQAYTRHFFKITYGAMSANWTLRLSRASVGASQLASAVDEKLLTACSEVVKQHGLRLVSVQPYLMSAFNQLKLQLQGMDAWFALAEPGSICLAQLQQGKWVRFRTIRLGNSWEEFSRFLLREAFMGGNEQQTTEQSLYLYAPHMGYTHKINGWKIIELPAPLPATLVEEDSSLVMALSGLISGYSNA